MAFASDIGQAPILMRRLELHVGQRGVTLAGPSMAMNDQKEQSEQTLATLRRLIRLEGRYGVFLRWGGLLFGLLAIWQWRGLRVVAPGAWRPEAYLFVFYVIVSSVLTVIFAPRMVRADMTARRLEARHTLLLAAHVLDLILISALVALTGGFRSEFYLLYVILALKAAIYFPFSRGPAMLSFTSGLLWVIASAVASRSLFFLVDPGFIVRYLTLSIVLVSCLAVGRLIERRQRSIVDLDADLYQKSRDLDTQAHVVQDTANELANRLLELRSLQESVKAINSSLALDELLQLIVESATRVLRGARCTIALVDDQRGFVVTKAAAGIARDQLWGTSFRIGQGVAGWVVENRQAVSIGSVNQDTRFRRVGQWPVATLISVPLISDAEGNSTAVMGALTATSPEPGAFSESDLDLLAAFADQAAIAVKNAALYAQLVDQEKQTARLYQSVLEKSNELEAVLRGIGDGVIVVDPQLRLLMMNPVAARMFHIHQAPQEGVRLPEIVANDTLLALARETLQDMDAPVIREISLPGEGDRSLIYQSLSSAVRGGNDHVRGVVIVMRDITSQKEIEQIKSNFLSVVSHELRTPLHSIKGFVDIILMGKTGEINELQRDFLTTVKDATTNLQRLIDDLLEFSRMEAGRVKLEPKEMSLFDVAEQVAMRLQPLADKGELKLANKIPEAIDLIEADPIRIEQVLTNLVSNAIKFTDANGSVTISAVDQGDEIAVAVADTGIGIPADEQPHIFQRFYQVDSSATRSYRGAGLGLTICKFIVEYHHGRIWVESELGKGSTFRFVLPKKLPQDQNLVIDFTTPVTQRSN
jgi:signal transduction histidine kinase